jgi:hypothetical protein
LCNNSGMSEFSRFRLVARPTLRRKGKANEIESVEFRALCDGKEDRVWRIDEWYLTTLFDVLESPEVVTEIICELREGHSVTFPDDYSGTQLVLMGFRIPMRKPPQAAFVPRTSPVRFVLR